MEIREAYKQKMAAQLKEWGAQINLLEAKVENAGASMKIRRVEAVNDLRNKQRSAAAKLQELEKSSSDAWEQIKTTTDNLWDDLKKGIADTQAKFK